MQRGIKISRLLFDTKSLNNDTAVNAHLDLISITIIYNLLYNTRADLAIEREVGFTAQCWLTNNIHSLLLSHDTYQLRPR